MYDTNMKPTEAKAVRFDTTLNTVCTVVQSILQTASMQWSSPTATLHCVLWSNQSEQKELTLGHGLVTWSGLCCRPLGLSAKSAQIMLCSTFNLTMALSNTSLMQKSRQGLVSRAWFRRSIHRPEFGKRNPGSHFQPNSLSSLTSGLSHHSLIPHPHTKFALWNTVYLYLPCYRPDMGWIQVRFLPLQEHTDCSTLHALPDIK